MEGGRKKNKESGSGTDEPEEIFEGRKHPEDGVRTKTRS